MFRYATLDIAGLAFAAGFALMGCQSSNAPSRASGTGGGTDPGAYVRTPYTVPGYEGPRVEGYFNTLRAKAPDGTTGAATAE